MLDRIENHLGNLRAAMNVRAYRQELLASNIANADTPHFKARDLDFAAALTAALGGQGPGDVVLAKTAAGHLDGIGLAGPYAAQTRYRQEYQGAVDGNTVNMDIERSDYAGNAIQLEAALTIIREKLRGLQMAIQGQ
jgi:flagellar basal-body rod protein FlgB